MGLDVSALAASVAASGKSQPDHQKTNKIPSAALEAAQHAAAAAAAAGPVPLAQPVSTSLPTFYNPAAVNVVKYTQQIQKRKLLWANKVLSNFFYGNRKSLFFLCIYSIAERGSPKYIDC